MVTEKQVEAAARAIADNDGFTHVWSKYRAEARAALTAAGVKPRVKPLVWKDSGGYLDASSVVGFYEIQKGGAPYDFSLNGKHTRELSLTIEAAKAAAQADYEARIMSALIYEGK